MANAHGIAVQTGSDVCTPLSVGSMNANAPPEPALCSELAQRCQRAVLHEEAVQQRILARLEAVLPPMAHAIGLGKMVPEDD